eukprot:gene8051-16509_t
MEAMAKSNSDINNQGDYSSIMIASLDGDMERVKSILAKNPSSVEINARNKDGDTALNLVIMNRVTAFGSGNVPFCRKDHVMEKFLKDQCPDGYKSIERAPCDSCHGLLSESSHFFHCKECAYDICGNCFTSTEESAAAATTQQQEKCTGDSFHTGEWRKQADTTSFCALDADDLKSCKCLCRHKGGVNKEDHWSCCGSSESNGKGCIKTNLSQIPHRGEWRVLSELKFRCAVDEKTQGASKCLCQHYG